MKRIETLEDVKQAMDLNEYFYGYACEKSDETRDYFAKLKHDDASSYVAKAKDTMAKIIDDSDDLGDMLIRLDRLTHWIDDALCDSSWTLPFDDSIQTLLDDGVAFKNIIIDGDKVYRLIECYAESDDKTFIMREDFYPSIDDWDEEDGVWEMPEQELMGWYCGVPEESATDQFYGKF